MAAIDKGPWQVGGILLYNLAAKQEMAKLGGTQRLVALSPDAKTVALTWATSQRAHLACVDLMTFTCTPIAVGHPDLPHDAMLALGR